MGRPAPQDAGVAHERPELPGLAQRRGVLGRDESLRAERGETCHGAGDPERRVRVGVLELVQLHDPLDVGEAATSELEVGARVGAARQALALHPRLEGADVAHLAGRDAALRPPQRVDEREEGVGQRRRRRRSGVARSSAWNSHVRAQRS